MRQSKPTLLLLATLLLILIGCSRKDQAGSPLSVDLRPGTQPALLYTYGTTAIRIDTIDERYKARFDRDTLDFLVLTDTTGLIEAVLIPDTTKLRYLPGKIEGARYADELMEWQRLIAEAGDSITPDLRDFYERMTGRRISLFYALDGLRRFPDQEQSLLERLLSAAQYSHTDLLTALGLSRETSFSHFPNRFGREERETKAFIKPDHFMAVLALRESDMDSTLLRPFYHTADSLGVKSLLLLIGQVEAAPFLPSPDRRTRFVGDSIGEASTIATTLGAERLPAYFVVDTLMSVIDRPSDLTELTRYILAHDTIPLKKSKRK